MDVRYVKKVMTRKTRIKMKALKERKARTKQRHEDTDT